LVAQSATKSATNFVIRIDMEEHSFGQWLRLRRKALDLTQDALADRVGCSVGMIRKIESEERRPSAQIAERLAEILAIPKNERSSFLRFARGESRSAPAERKEEFPWQASATLARSNLPAAVTSLIGREREIAEVHNYFSRDDIRLVTLIGPPGIGKTRLGIESARIALQDFPDGVFFIRLAPLDDPSLIVPTVAQALNFVERNRQSSTEQLSDGIRDKQMLLVLDNCEHLIEDVAALVSFLLSTCPLLKILTTSRESLRVPGEWIYAVPAFDLPAEHFPVDVESTAQYPALMLFAERARAIHADFSLTPENIETVSAICARLDGLPLVIELMAARMRFMSPEDLLDRLTGQFMLTADGMRAASERQKTLQHAIDWSYQLLQPEEQKLFAYLSVFTGNFSLEMVENMLSEKSMSRPVPDLLVSLLDKSLLKRAPDSESSNEVRYMMLVTLREYARNRLREMGEESQIRNRHLTYYLRLAEKASHELRGPHQVVWLRGLASVRDDLRSALDWVIETQQTEAALQMGSYLSWFWFRRSDLGEGRQWLEKVVNLPDASQYPHWYSNVLTELARGTWLHVGAGQARPFVEKAISVAQQHDDQWNVAQASLILRLVLIGEGDFTGAQEITAKSKTFFRNVHDERGYAHAVHGHALIAFLQDDITLALALHEESLAIFRRLGDKFFQNVALRFIGIIQLRQGNLKGGQEVLREALRLAREIDTKYEIAAAIEHIGDAALAEGDPARAIHLYWASRNIYDSIGVWQKEHEAKFENQLALCRTRLSEPEFAAAIGEGSAMTLDQAINAALLMSMDP
jgi:predicted ATPase/DNA-binding XRE family transcriptional regulator